jgi:hypothetical protein
MQREKFVLLLRKYLKNQLSTPAKTLIENWFTSIGKNDTIDIDATQETELKKRYYKAIKRRIDTSESRRLSFTHWKEMSIAASLLAFVCVGIYLYRHNSAVAIEAHPNLSKVLNTDGVDKTITLPDGSKVILHHGSEIEYFKTGGQTAREVYLKGTAFFDVTHNPSQPFVVYTNNLITKVLGTSFTIDENETGDVLVSVKTGRVSVFSNEHESQDKNQQQVILTPNQKVLFKSKDQKMVSGLVEKPQQIDNQQNILDTYRREYLQAPAAEIFEAMEKLYGVPIDFELSEFSTCKVTTSLESGDLYDRLNIVCEVLNATYTIDGLSIKIKGVGCENVLED